MFLRLRSIAIVIGSLLCLWVGWHVYGYFFDTTFPVVNLSGIRERNYYSGDIQGIINVSHRYNVADIAVFLDGKAMGSPLKVNKRNFDCPLPICTKTLAGGEHVLRVEVTNGTMRKNKSVHEIIFYVDNMPLQAAYVRPDVHYKVSQGRTFHLQFQTNKVIKKAQIQMFAKIFDCYPESSQSLIYECFIPIACEEKPNEYPFVIEIEDHVGNRMTLEGKLQVIPYSFRRRALHVDKNKIEAEKEVSNSQALFVERFAKLIQQSPRKKLWNGMFIAPAVYSGLACSFGEIRTTQEKGRYTHDGLDLLAYPKSVVWATQDGRVVLKDRYAQSGNTVVIDHGHQIFSLFFHLDGFADINEGDEIKKGNPIGTVGKTGYATGYHLHWEMRIGNTPVDPMQWTKHDF